MVPFFQFYPKYWLYSWLDSVRSMDQAGSINCIVWKVGIEETWKVNRFQMEIVSIQRTCSLAVLTAWWPYFYTPFFLHHSLRAIISDSIRSFHMSRLVVQWDHFRRSRRIIARYSLRFSQVTRSDNSLAIVNSLRVILSELFSIIFESIWISKKLHLRAFPPVLSVYCS